MGHNRLNQVSSCDTLWYGETGLGKKDWKNFDVVVVVSS